MVYLIKSAQSIGLERLLGVSEPDNLVALFRMGKPISNFIKNHLKTMYVSFTFYSY